MNAFLYLSWTSARNRFWFQIRRVKSPRYLIALLVAGFYIWGFLIRPKTPIGSVFLTRPAETIVTLLLVVTLSGAWIFGSDTLALAFTQAELSMLFPAPLSRRALIGYKLYRAQIAVLINSLIWVFILKRGGTALPGPLRAIGIWILFSTLNLHRLGAALVRSSWREHGRAGAKRNRWSIAFFVAVAVLVVSGLVVHRAELMAAGDIGDFLNVLSGVLSKGPASYGLLPFHLVVAPTFATTVSAWLRAVPFAAGVLALHALWVLNTDTAFEDAAIEASAERSRRLESFRRNRSLGALKAPKVKKSLKLATRGHPAWAIFWKNILCLRRTAQWRLLIGPATISIVFGTAAGAGDRSIGNIVTGTCLMFAAMLLLFGGRLIRNDLRHDMLHLPLIKSLPLSPRDVMLAEIASSALPMAAAQLALVLAAFVAALTATDIPVPLSVRFGILAAAPFAAVALNGALLTMQNGLAVLFPAWIRLGSTVSTGVEALGQNLLATLANMLSLVLSLIVPTIIAFVAVKYLMISGALAIAATIIFASGMLALEIYAVMGYLSRAFARAEPPSTA